MAYGEKFFRRRRDGETTAAAMAIRLQCSECFSHNPSEVDGCTDLECWLYPWRVGTPASRKRKMTAEQREACGDRFRKARDAK